MSLIVYGAVVGCLYGLWATSFSLIYRATKIFHVIHASVFVLSGYVYWIVSAYAGSLVALLIALIVGVLLGVGAEIILYRSLLKRGATPVLLFVVSLGGYIVIENIILLIWGAGARIAITPWENTAKIFVQVGGAGLSVFEITEAAIAVALWLGVLAMLRWTLIGKAMRAIANSPEMSELAGVDVDNIRIAVIAIGSLLISFAGITTTIRAGIEPSSGLSIWIVAVICTLISRAEPFQSFFSGIFLGISEAALLFWIPATWQPGIPVLILLLYLVASSARSLILVGLAKRNAKRNMVNAHIRV